MTDLKCFVAYLYETATRCLVTEDILVPYGESLKIKSHLLQMKLFIYIKMHITPTFAMQYVPIIP